MIISHKYRFIFIKTQKTAGTSIEVFLSQLCGPDDIVTPINPYVAPHSSRNYSGIFNPCKELIRFRGRYLRRTIRDFVNRRKFYNHIPARHVQTRVKSEIWNNYYKFCVERNPFDKTLSHYHHLNFRSTNDLSLEEYFQRKQFCINFPFYTDTRGKQMVDRVIKYENLIEEFREVCSFLGIDFYGDLGVNAKSEFRKDRTPYHEILTQSQRKILECIFSDEINRHGYKF